MQKLTKKILKIGKAQNNLNECKVNVSFHYLCHKESLETLTCVISGSELVLSIDERGFFMIFSAKTKKKTF